MDGASTSFAFSRFLTSGDQTTRTLALHTLPTWLSSHSSILVTADLTTISESLFYSFWHADDPPISLVSSLVSSLDSALSARFIAAFLSTLRREWPGVDRPRIDRFRVLLRRILHHIFLLLRKNSWNLDLSIKLMSVLEESSLLSVDHSSGQGFSLHIVEIFLDEVNKVLRIPLEALEIILKPFFSVMERSDDKVLARKVKFCVFDPLHENGVKLLELLKEGKCVDLGDGVKRIGKVALELGLSKKLLDSASALRTLQGNRKVLFSLHHRFLRLEKEMEDSGLLQSIQQLDYKDLVENSEQIELGNECVVEYDENGEDCTPKVTPLHDSVVQKEFAKDAAKSTEENDDAVECAVLAVQITSAMPKKRKTVMMLDKHASVGNGIVDGKVMYDGIIGENNAKKVKFSMRNNLMWKLNNPLPPQSLRLPPSLSPRGSALKKGVPPGPIKEMPITVKEAKVKANQAKKRWKISKAVSQPPKQGPPMSSLRKLLPQSKSRDGNLTC